MIRWLPIAALALAPLPAMAQDDAQPVQEQLQQLRNQLRLVQDELAIRHIFVDYAAALDARDADAYVALFAKDAEWINGSLVRKGPQEIHDLVAGMFKNTPPDFVNRESFELTFNPDIELDGDHATARSSHLLFRRGPDGTPMPVLFGRYEDEFVREGGTWKILRRIDVPTMPTAEEWGKMMRARQAQQGQ